MMPQHHPGDDLLLAYATGTQAEPTALVVATHLALCPRCRKEVAWLEELGGALLEARAPEPISDDGLGRLLAALDDDPPEAPEPPACRHGQLDSLIPEPLRGYLGGTLDQLDWSTFRGLAKVELLRDCAGFQTRLMRIKSGTAMPTHTHEGSELTLVLAGGFSDEQGHFLRGDVAEADVSVVHQPIVDSGEDCLCLAVTDGPLRLTGPFGRLLNPFLRI